MKKTVSLILAFVMVVAFIPSELFTFKAEAATSVYYTYTISNGEATITDVKTSISGDIIIPSSLGGYPVTSIGDSAFEDCTRLTSVTIPNGVISIDTYAFYYCTSLMSITIPDSVTSIGRAAFFRCDRLKDITLPFVGSSRTASGTADAVFGYIFGYTTSLNSDGPAGSVRPETTEQYYYSSGSYSSGSRYAYYYIPSSIKTVTITDATQIPYGAFYNCKNLTSITIPASVTSIDGYAFYGCSSLTTVNITDLAAWCNINFRSSSSNPLYYAKKLYINGILATDITIPDSVTSIGDYTFYNCSRLTSVTIPDSVTSIGYYAFEDCSGLTTVNITNLAAWCNIDFESSSSSPLYYAKKLYINGILATDITIPDSVTSIGDCAFYNCSVLSNITIPDSVTSIGEKAFYNTAYYNNSSNWQDNVLYIGNHLINAKTSLSGPYEIKSGAKTIAGEAFYNCTELTSITIPYSVTNIGRYAFYNCYDLNDVYYCGTADEWDKVRISDGNAYLTGATRYYHKYDNVCDTTCNLCGNVREVEPHKYDNVCDTTCNICNYTRTVEHSYEWVIDAEATCTDSGTKHQECTICHNEINKTEIPAFKHNYEWIIDVEAICINSGLKHQECIVCHDKINETIIPAPETKHDYVYDGYLSKCRNCLLALNPGKPVATKTTPICVELQKYKNYEYSMDAITWQTSNVFTGLTADTSYTFYQRVKETNTNLASAKSEALVVKTPSKSSCSISPAKPIVADYTISKVVLVARDGYEYSIDGVNWTTNSTFADLKPNTKYTFYQRIAETATEKASSKSAGVSVTTDELIIDSSSSYNLILLKEYVKLNGTPGSDGRYTISITSSTSDQTTNLIVKNDKLYITFSHSFGNTQVGMAWTMEFQITDETKYLVIDYFCRYWAKMIYSKNDDVTEQVIIDRSAHTTSTKYTLKGEGKRLVSNEAFTNDFNDILNVTLSAWDSYIYDKLGFGLRGLGFISYDGCGKTVCDWHTGYHTGSDEIRNKRNATCTVDGYTGDTYCSQCGQIKKKGSSITCTGSHSYTNCAKACSICGEERIVEHIYSNDCDKNCNLCNAERVVSHLYDNECDSKCNECGFERKAPHIYEDRKDLVCNHCGYERPPYTEGDLTGDDKINSLDGLMLLRYLNGWNINIAVPEAMDVNGDGKVNSLDGLMLLRYLNGWNIQL